MTINANFLIVYGIVTALLWVPAGWRLYREDIPLQWLFSISFILGSLGITYFYYESTYGLLGTRINFIALSRILWLLFLSIKALLAVSVLVYRK